MIKTILVNNLEVKISDLKINEDLVSFILDGQSYQYKISQIEDGAFISQDIQRNLSYKVLGKENYLSLNGKSFEMDYVKLQRGVKKSHDEGSLISPMPGKILKLMVSPGDQVVAGQALMVLEAMKMEHTIKSNKNGIVETIAYKVGDQVTGGVELVQIS